jgi:uncharacterized damage-inducible protein DinB
MAAQAHRTDLGNREFFIQRWEQESPAFVRVFRALPSNRLDYRPHAKSRSAAELVALLVSAQQSCIDLCKNRKSFYNGLRWKEPGPFGGIEDMIATYQRDSDMLSGHFRTLEGEAWYQQAWLIQGDEDIVLKDTIGGLLWIALFDFVHHRGQLSTYIRPMGGTVPSIYGPSADAPAQSEEQH